MSKKIFTYLFLSLVSVVNLFLLADSLFAEDCLNSGKQTPCFSIKPSDFSPFRTGSGGSTPLGMDAIVYILGKVSEILFYFIPIIAGISFIVAGYYYILSSGDSEKASQAKTIIKWNLVAIFVSTFSYMLIKLLAWVISN